MQDNPRPEKAAVVEEVKQRFGAAQAALLTEYRGLTVKEIAVLRRSLREAGGEYKIYKNTLVRFAVRDSGLEALEPLLEGPTAIAFVEGDAVGVAKALRDFGRTNPNLVIKGGLLGEGVLDARQAGALADIPPREVLLARLAGGLAAPLQQFAGLLQALPRNFAYGLKALIDSRPPDGSPETTGGDAPMSASDTPSGDEPIETDPPNEPRDSEPEPAPDTGAEAEQTETQEDNQ